jgi:23S rRNA (pseudouridine1915-N3)-methyltransferase
MKILLLLPAPLKDRGLQALAESYVARLRGRFSVEIVSVRQEKSESPRALEIEAERLRAQVPKGFFRVALDATGRQHTSEDFARWLDTRVRESTRGIAFLIGSANGLDRALVQEVDLVLSLSKMTLPHQMAVTLLTEQLYRADAILRGAPYHR